MLKKIIEKIILDMNQINQNRGLSPFDIVKKINVVYAGILPDLEKESALEEEMAKALIFNIKCICNSCHESNICKDTCIHGKQKYLIEKYYGKKWEEIQ